MLIFKKCLSFLYHLILQKNRQYFIQKDPQSWFLSCTDSPLSKVWESRHPNPHSYILFPAYSEWKMPLRQEQGRDGGGLRATKETSVLPRLMGTQGLLLTSPRLCSSPPHNEFRPVGYHHAPVYTDLRILAWHNGVLGPLRWLCSDLNYRIQPFAVGWGVRFKKLSISLTERVSVPRVLY